MVGGFINNNEVAEMWKGNKKVWPLYASDGLVQHYDAIVHGDTTEIWSDLVGSNDGVIKNAVWSGDSLVFNGVNSIVEYSGEITPRYTMMGVVAVEHLSANYNPRFTDGNLTYGAGIYFARNASNNDWAYALWGHGKDTVFVPRTPSKNGIRVHIAYLFNGSAVRLYINGTYTGQIATTQEAQSRATTYLGGSDYPNRLLKGEICNFMRYDRNLADDEIYNNYFIDKKRFNIQ